LRGVDAWRIHLDLDHVGRAVEDFPSVLDDAQQLGAAQGAIAFVGASDGALVATSIVAAGAPEASALALVSPVLGCRGLDVVSRAAELARHRVPTCVVAGTDDDAETIIDPAEELCDALVLHGVEALPFVIPGSTAAAVDIVLTGWFNDLWRREAAPSRSARPLHGVRA
jgi:predicted esterase